MTMRVGLMRPTLQRTSVQYQRRFGLDFVATGFASVACVGTVTHPG